MQYTTLGRTGLIVSRLSFGAMTFSNTYGSNLGVAKSDQGVADALVGQALDAGINFFDTADVYSSGQSEEILGRALAARRDDVVIATKVAGRMAEPLIRAGLNRRHILWSIDQSLRRLGTDWVDVYIAHTEDPYTPLEETLEALDAVVRSGKARYIGFSNWSAWKVAAALELQKANGWAQFTHGQMHYSLIGRDIERDIVPMMQHYGLGLTVWSPLTSGFLSGKYTRENLTSPDGRYGSIDFIPFDKERGFELLEQLRGIAEARGVSVAQVALAWLLAKSHVTSIILGANKAHQLEDNLGAADLTLDADTVGALDAVNALSVQYPGWHHDMFHDRAAAQALGKR